MFHDARQRMAIPYCVDIATPGHRLGRLEDPATTCKPLFRLDTPEAWQGMTVLLRGPAVRLLRLLQSVISTAFTSIACKARCCERCQGQSDECCVLHGSLILFGFKTL